MHEILIKPELDVDISGERHCLAPAPLRRVIALDCRGRSDLAANIKSSREKPPTSIRTGAP
jgi:hypothetical protein